ncbi:low-density lipoprotein receptor-related protein 12-like [Saccoglossus kowalevskii]|uniref:Sortilin-related receptor-like n=1 Tax=Saccoglossus kowalevskii TaxID=10224 RepID=A0ABM0GMA6_SACKO|nr:PREDICTED: sortilin-related receptor-like [Saccoglossus kowalevskii]
MNISPMSIAVLVLVCVNVAFSIPTILDSCFSLSRHFGDPPFECVRWENPAQHCVRPDWHCDSIVDCQDGSDELADECAEQFQSYCDNGFIGKYFSDGSLLNKYQCDNGMCIEECRRCDGVYNCADLSDEADCETIQSENCTLQHHGQITEMPGVDLF